MVRTSKCGAVFRAVFHWPTEASEVRDFFFPPMDSNKVQSRPVGRWSALDTEKHVLEWHAHAENVAACLDYCRDNAYAVEFRSVCD